MGSVTPSAIAAAIREAARVLAAAPPVPSNKEAARLLEEALDTVEDGLPPDVTEVLLDRAARLLR